MLMYKKLCVIFMIILLINIMTINVFASSTQFNYNKSNNTTQTKQLKTNTKMSIAMNAGYGQSGGVSNAGNSSNSGQQTKPPVYNTGNPSTGTPNYVTGNEKIDTREKLEEKLKAYVKEGTLELNALGKQESSLGYIQGVLNQVPEETLQQWYNTDGKADFNDYSKLVRDVDRGLNQNSNLRDRIQYMDNNFADWRDHVNNNNGTNNSMTDSPQENNKDQNSSEETPSTGVLAEPGSLSAKHTPDEIIKEGNSFIQSGTEQTIKQDQVQQASTTLYNVLLSIGMFAAIAIGVYLGIKFMSSSADDKAKVKEALIPYIVGCVVIFGAFGIWKLLIMLLQPIEII